MLRSRAFGEVVAPDVIGHYRQQHRGRACPIPVGSHRASASSVALGRPPRRHRAKSAICPVAVGDCGIGNPARPRYCNFESSTFPGTVATTEGCHDRTDTLDR